MSHRLAPTPVHFLLILGAALGAAFPALAQTPVAIGEDLQVNTFTSSLQSLPLVGLDGDGGWVVAWTSDGSANGDTSGWSVQGQRYGADATAQGGNFLINELTSGNQQEQALVVREQGDFITVFTSQASPHDADRGISWRRFAAQSQTGESEIQINAFHHRYAGEPVPGRARFRRFRRGLDQRRIRQWRLQLDEHSGPAGGARRHAARRPVPHQLQHRGPPVLSAARELRVGGLCGRVGEPRVFERAVQTSSSSLQRHGQSTRRRFSGQRQSPNRF